MKELFSLNLKEGCLVFQIMQPKVVILSGLITSVVNGGLTVGSSVTKIENTGFFYNHTIFVEKLGLSFYSFIS